MYTDLTQRETEVVVLITEGTSNSEISERLNISVHTVKMHIKHILEKLEAKNRTQAVFAAIKNGIIKF